MSDKPYDTVEGLSEEEAARAWKASKAFFALNFRKDLLAEGRRQERERIADWLRKHGYTQIAKKVEDGEHHDEGR